MHVLSSSFLSTLLSGVCAARLLGPTTAAAAHSEWVYPGSDGRLVYQATPRGDRIMDFSHAGYGGGGVALPEVPVVKTVSPTGNGEDAAAIQAAIDLVSTRPATDGFRGAVHLTPGTFHCAEPLRITANGVVLRGSGSGAELGATPTTTIRLTGTPHVAVLVRAPREAASAPDPGFATTIADNYVPSGASSFMVSDGSGFAVGDPIIIHRPVTEAWIRFMQMDDLIRDGRPQTWLRAGDFSTMERRIVAREGTRLTVDRRSSAEAGAARACHERRHRAPAHRIAAAGDQSSRAALHRAAYRRAGLLGA
jgi:hypothetical protein